MSQLKTLSGSASSGLIRFLGDRRGYIIFAVCWVLVWVIPWAQVPTVEAGSPAAFATDMLRLTIALAMFVTPGILLYALIGTEDEFRADAAGLIPIGFTLSVLAVGVIGFAGRVLGLSFTIVAALFGMLGLVEIALLMRRGSAVSAYRDLIHEMARGVFKNPLLVLALCISVLGLFGFSLFFIDDTSYLAYMTSWQRSAHLSFQNIVYAGNAVEIPRFWLAMYPMGQALLSWLSGVPGLLLLSHYLEFLLVPIAVLASFWLASSLGLSARAASVATLIQVCLYSWMQGDQWPAGFWFFTNMAEDKVTAVFILAPVFLVFGLRYVLRPDRGRLALLLLAAFSLALTHPVSQFYAIFVLGVMGLIARFLQKTTWRAVFALTGVCGLSLLPNAIIRVSPAVSQLPNPIPFDGGAARDSFEISRYTSVVNDIFYGLNPAVLEFFDLPEDSPLHAPYQFFRIIPVLIMALAAVVAVIRLRRGPLYWYVLACLSLVAAATVPYTGWILGYFVSARLISRASWFAPLGVGAVVILLAVQAWRRKKDARALHTSPIAGRSNSGFLGGLVCTLFAMPLLAYGALPRLPAYFVTLAHNKQLAQVGDYIDLHSQQPVTATAFDYADTLLLPGVSAHVRLISFREEVDYNPHNNFLSLDAIRHRRHANSVISSLDPTVDRQERCSLLQVYQVRFIVVPRERAQEYEDALTACPERGKVVYSTPELVLLELQ